MKKNVMMRVASALLVAVLMTTCAISGTFAKYTTTASGKDVARVARWGFNTDSITIDMFSNAYNGTVASAYDDNVVAPGTTYTADIDFTPAAGTPEVSYTFDVNVSKSDDTNAELLAKLVWSLNGTKAGSNGTFAELVEAVNTLCDQSYTPGQQPDDISITWEWPFTTDDATDTALGNGAAAKLEIIVSYTATQVD